MKIRRRAVLEVATSSVAAAAATKLSARSAFAESPRQLVRDVCVLGGGSAGTYTAVRLRDLGKSVVVVEKQDRLGGHAHTVHAGPASSPIDIGVVVFENKPIVTSYLGRFNVPLVPITFGSRPPAYVDFRTGQPVDYVPPAPAAVGAALGAYIQLLKREFPYLGLGFRLPSPVPADLLLPFGDFVTKYGLDALVPTIFAFGQGLGNLLEVQSLYVLKNFSLSVAEAIATSSFVVPVGGTRQLYDAAARFLGSDVLFEAQATCVRRTSEGIVVHVETPDGPYRIHCGKLVVAFPPTRSGLEPLDLDALEASTLGRFRANYYGTALVRISGLPAGLSVTNVAASTRSNLAPLPGIYGISPTPVDGFYTVKYGSPFWLPDHTVKANIATDIERLRTAGSLPAHFDGFHTFSSHAPFALMVPREDIARGFYGRLESLQGRNDTFYTGAAFETNDSFLIWQFTESLLPRIVA